MIIKAEITELKRIPKKGKYDLELDEFLSSGYTFAEVILNDTSAKAIIQGLHYARKRRKAPNIKIHQHGTRVFLELVQPSTK